jgi:hypothetical protein
LDDKTPKGYEREDFEDSFRRYLRTGTTPAPSNLQSATTQQVNTNEASSDFLKRNNNFDIAAAIWPKANDYKPCCTVADSTSPRETAEGELEDDL